MKLSRLSWQGLWAWKHGLRRGCSTLPAGGPRTGKKLALTRLCDANGSACIHITIMEVSRIEFATLNLCADGLRQGSASLEHVCVWTRLTMPFSG